MSVNPVEQIDALQSPAAEQLQRWRSVLLQVVLGVLVFGTVSGNLLFFFGGYLDDSALIGRAHWIVGLCGLLPWAIYQWRHYLRVQRLTARLHFKLGLWTFVSICVMTLSGIPLLFAIPGSAVLFRIIDLTHVVSSFVFLMLLMTHLLLVIRVTLANRDSARMDLQAAARLIARTLWLPSVLAVALLIVIAVLSRG